MSILEAIWFAVTSTVWWIMAHWIISLIIVAVVVTVTEAFDRASRVIESAKQDLDH